MEEELLNVWESLIQLDVIDKTNDNLNEWFKDIKLNKKSIINIQSCIKNCQSPSKKDIFKAFSLFKPSETRVLILGQDPYTDNEEGKATGLAFLLNRKPNGNDSLYYILKAISNEDNFKFNEKPDFNKVEEWVKNKGILLLNTSLTYDKTSSKSDRINCWKPFITQIIKKIKDNPLEIYLWGGDAQNKFFQILNEIKDTSLINKIIVNNNFPKEKKRNDNKGFKNSVVTDKYSVNIENKILTLFLSVHPSKINYINNRKFDYKEQFGDKEYWQKLSKIYTENNK